MLADLRAANKVIGVKQSKKAVKDGAAAMVYIALDAEKRIIAPIYELCEQTNTPVQEIAAMSELGNAVGIDVGAAVVTVLR